MGKVVTRLKPDKRGMYTISSIEDLELALDEFVKLEEEVRPVNNKLVALKAAATKYAIANKVSVVQLDDVYFRQIQRNNRGWDHTLLQKLVKGMTVKTKSQGGKLIPLWQLITKRVPDPEKIQEAIAKGWVKEKEIQDAFIEKPQNPFLQKFEGMADD